jgi:ABC-type glycerol-3-phosphate transport system substrate-binding protein
VTYQPVGNSKVQANFLNEWAKKFTAAHPKVKVKLQPITASENDYYTKAAAVDALASNRAGHAL